MQANRAAVTANQAYRTGDLDAARQLTDQAAVLDPSRADLWQQHRGQIAARSLIVDAQAAHTDGDHQRVQDLLGQARQLDQRMPAIWDGDLPGLPPARTACHSREHEAAPGPDSPADSSRAVARGGRYQAASPPQPTKDHPGHHGPDHQPEASRASPAQGQRKRPSRRRPRRLIPPQCHATPDHRQESPQATHSPTPNRPMTTRPPAGPRPILVPPRKPARPVGKVPTWPPRAGPPGRLSEPVLRRTPRPAIRRTPEILPCRRTGVTSFSLTPAGHGRPPRASPATRPHPSRPNTRHHAWA